MKKFITPVSMKVTYEQYKKDLEQPLKELGYKSSPQIGENKQSFDRYPILMNLWIESGLTNRGVFNKLDDGAYFIYHYNPELFLALSAMTKGEDWIVGEWLYNFSKDTFFKCRELSGANSDMGLASNNNKHIYRKATLEELVNHFTEFVLPEKWGVSSCKELVDYFKNIDIHWRGNDVYLYYYLGVDGKWLTSFKTHDKERIEITFDQFKKYVLKQETKKQETKKQETKKQDKMKKQDFTIEGTTALKEAFVKDGDFGNSAINFRLNLTSSKKQNNLTSQLGKQEKHFILPQDWNSAMEYVKDFFKSEFKVGDYIVALGCFDERARKITKYETSFDALKWTEEGEKNDFNHSWDLKKIRHATPEEIKEYESRNQLPKINGYDGEVEGDFLFYGNNCAKLPLAWFKEHDGATRHIKSLELSTGVKITEQEMNQIRKVINK